VAPLDDHFRETVKTLLESLKERLESELSTVQDELVARAQDASARAAAEAAESATAEVRREAAQQLDEVRNSALRDVDEQRVRYTTEIDELRRLLDVARQDVDAARQDAQRHADDAHERRKDAEAARGQIEALTNELEEARKQLDVTRDDVEATLRDIEAVRREWEAARGEVNRLTRELRNKDERALQARGLPDAISALDQAATFGEVLETLASRAGREAGRAAAFLVKGSRLSSWRMVGFGPTSEASRVDIDVNECGLISEAVRSGHSVSPVARTPVPEFAHTDEPRIPGAWPVSVGGSVVAVLYADGAAADNAEEPFWPAFLDVLARHAGRVLEGITVRQAAGLMTGKTTASTSSAVGRRSSGSMQ
jgi:predicted  nucleic acid-binding Zn-ribbon protein